jgi:hypothetical protein
VPAIQCTIRHGSKQRLHESKKYEPPDHVALAVEAFGSSNQQVVPLPAVHGVGERYQIIDVAIEQLNPGYFTSR